MNIPLFSPRTPRGRGVALVFALLLPSLAPAQPKPAKEPDALDFAANQGLWKSHMGRYGRYPTRVVLPDPAGVRLRLPAENGGAKQTGLYSYFALSGDCEVSVDYEVLSIPPPKSGYGAGLGLVFDTKGPAGEVMVRRGTWVEKEGGSGVQFATIVPQPGGEAKFESQFYPSSAKRGKLMLRREKKEVIAFVADDWKGELLERGRFPFGTGTVREFRITADCGGSPTPVEARVLNLRVRGEELTGGIPERDQQSTPRWVYAASALLAALVVGAAWRLWFRKREDDD